MSELAPFLARAAATQGGCFLTAQAVIAGYSVTEIQSSVRRGAWVRLRRGAYCDASWWRQASTQERHLAHARAAQLQLGAWSPLSHGTAALLHGFPLIGEPPPLPELTVQREFRSSAPSIKLYTARLFPGHSTVKSGVPVTTEARTISDLARSRPMLHAVAAGDAALKWGTLEVSDFDVILRDCWTWRGIARTKRVVAMLDARSESVGESISRLRILEHGLPTPELQMEVVIEGRRYRTDFGWRDQRVIGEFDGKVKYGRGSDLFAEKRREDALRSEGWSVVRWVWDEIWGDSPEFIRRLNRALASQAAG